MTVGALRDKATWALVNGGENRVMSTLVFAVVVIASLGLAGCSTSATSTHRSKAPAALSSGVTTCTQLLPVSTAVHLAGVPTYPPIQVSRFSSRFSQLPGRITAACSYSYYPQGATSTNSKIAAVYNQTLFYVWLNQPEAPRIYAGLVNGVPTDPAVAISGVGLQAAVPPEGGGVIVQATSSDVFALYSGGPGSLLSAVEEAKQIVSELGGSNGPPPASATTPNTVTTSTTAGGALPVSAAVLGPSYAATIGFTKTVQAPKETAVTSQAGCTQSVEAVYEDAVGENGLVSESLQCSSDAAATQALASAREKVTVDSSFPVPQQLGPTAFATDTDAPEYIVTWVSGSQVAITAIDFAVGASTSTSSTVPPVPLTPAQTGTLISAAVEQNSLYG